MFSDGTIKSVEEDVCQDQNYSYNFSAGRSFALLAGYKLFDIRFVFLHIYMSIKLSQSLTVI